MGLSGEGNLVRQGRSQLSSGPALLRRRQLQGLRRRAVPPARARFRGASPQGRHFAGMAAEIRDFEPYYAEAERLFHVHGQRGEDPTEPPSSGPFPYPPVSTSRDPGAQRQPDGRADCIHFILPLGILLDEKDGKPTPTSICIRCDAFDGFPCPLNGKADAQVMCVDPALQGAPEPDAADRRLCLASWKPTCRAEASPSVHVTRRRAAGALLGRHRGRRLRRAVLGAAAVALGQREASKRSCQWLRIRSAATTCGTISRS